jgi:hypothetical protein
MKMTDKALISELTWRGLEMQRAIFHDMPHYFPEEISSLLRPSSRNRRLRVHVVSFGVIAAREESFREFLDMAKKIKCEIVSYDDDKTFGVNGNCENLVKLWKDARRKGAANIGANVSAANKKAKSAIGIRLIKDRWPLPSSEWKTKDLLAEAGVSLNTAKAHLGKRPIAQYNHQAKLKRKANAR